MRRLLLLLAMMTAGCHRPGDHPELLWGRRGVLNGDFVKPRAIAIDRDDRLYLVDMTARIQAFDRDGKFLGLSFRPPDYSNGRPSGLSIHPDGNLLVSDSHYHCARVYSPQGELLRTIGDASELGYVSDAVCDDAGNFYLAEFGENQRITKYDRDGKLLFRWGSAGTEPGQFARIRSLAFGPDGMLYAVDACNHRIQVFTTEGTWVRSFGTSGSEPGQLLYPYDLAFSRGSPAYLYVAELGNHRVQKFDLAGKSLGIWGGPGREPGRLHHPWALAVDSKGKVHVVDSENDRVQRIDF